MDQHSDPRDDLLSRYIARRTAGDDLVLIRVCSVRVLGRLHAGVGSAGVVSAGVVFAGVVFAGVVEGAGEYVRAFQPGDAVCGSADGVFAGYVCVSQDRLTPMPATLSFDDAVADYTP